MELSCTVMNLVAFVVAFVFGGGVTLLVLKLMDSLYNRR